MRRTFRGQRLEVIPERAKDWEQFCQEAEANRAYWKEFRIRWKEFDDAVQTLGKLGIALNREDARIRMNAKQAEKQDRLTKSGLRKNKPKAIERDGNKCIVCGKPQEAVHHVVNFERSGDSSLDNLVCLCHLHHNVAHGDIRSFLSCWNPKRNKFPRNKMIGLPVCSRYGRTNANDKNSIRAVLKAYSIAEDYASAVYKTVGRKVPIRVIHFKENHIDNRDCLALAVGKFTTKEFRETLRSCLLPVSEDQKFYQILLFPEHELANFIFGPVEEAIK